MITSKRVKVEKLHKEPTFRRNLDFQFSYNYKSNQASTMLLFKTLAISTMATLSPLGGHVGPGLAAATAAVAEDWKDGGSVSARFRERRTICEVEAELTHSF